MIARIRLVIVWTAATAIGAFLALLAAQIFLVVIEEVVWVSADEILVAGTLGLFTGVCQWLALRSSLTRVDWWVPSSLIGGMSVGLAANQIGSQASTLVAFGVYGSILGVFQWLVLRTNVRASWKWIPVSGIAWLLGSQAIVWLDRVVLEYSWPFSELVTVAIMYGLLGAIAGALSGIVLAWMITNSEESYPTHTDLMSA